MEEFATAGYRAKDRVQLNVCRMFLHSVTLSDITSVRGERITPGAWEYGRRLPHSGSTFAWPWVQSSLPASYWNIWRLALHKCFLKPGSSRLIWRHLGSWKSHPTNWEGFYSTQEDRLYKKERLLWRAFPQLFTGSSPWGGISEYRKSDTLARVPAKDLIHVLVNCRGDFATKVSTENIPVPCLLPTPILSFEDIRRSRNAGFSWAISKVTVPTNATVLASALVWGKAIAVSDGSFKNAQGTAGFVIEGNTRCGRLVGVNAIPGELEYQFSYRSEIGGVAGILESLHCVCKAHSIMDGAIEIGLDGEQAMIAMVNNWPLDPGNPDYNLLQHVRGRIKALPLTITFRWIASHQDKNKTFAELDRWEQLNVECDKLAKRFWNTCALARSRPRSLQLGHEKWSLWIEG
jgi:hypothetical protein